MTNEDYLKRFDRFQKNRQTFFAPKINYALHKQYLQFISTIREYGLHGVEFISSKSVETVIRNLYMDAGVVYGKKIQADLQKEKRTINKKSLEFKSGQFGFSERIAELIAEYFQTDILNTSQGITETTKDLIRTLFTESYTLGLSLDQIVKKLENTELSRVRSRLIARTETVTASNQAGRFVAKESGLQLNKIWLSASDSRVRNDHKAVNGQMVAFDDYFIVGGFQMLHPGDHGGENGIPEVPAKEVVNCRCVCQYRPID